MERGIFYGLLWSLIVGAFGMLQFTVALWANPRPSAIVAHISAYIAVAILCVFALREARAAKPNKNGWWGTIGAILGFLIGQQTMLCLACLVFIAGGF
jgi:drug/metabolite transporter (DMT)-like permease